MSGKIGSITTDIIRNGLVFNMDAANRASYIPNATTSFNTINLSESGSFVNDPTYISPPTSASCWDFDGTDDYINCGASTLSGETALSISAWVYPTAYGDATAPSFVSTDKASPRAFYLGLFNATNFRFSISTNGTALTSLDTTSSTVTLNAWQHILVTWDQINLKLYKNGVLLKTVATTSSSNGTFTTTNNLLIGARRSDIAGPFPGNIADVQIYNRALSSTEVLHNYNALKDRFGL